MALTVKLEQKAGCGASVEGLELNVLGEMPSCKDQLWERLEEWRVRERGLQESRRAWPRVQESAVLQLSSVDVLLHELCKPSGSPGVLEGG